MLSRARAAAVAFTAVGLGLACGQAGSNGNLRRSAASLDALTADVCNDDGCCACAREPADSDDPERYSDGLSRDAIDAIDDEDTLDDEYPETCAADAGDAADEAGDAAPEVEASPYDTVL